MFALDGRLSSIAVAARAVIRHCGLDVNPAHENSVAITVYQIDPTDGYFYLVACAGLREIEPMFGPLRRQTDYRKDPDGPSLTDCDGFREREGIGWTLPIIHKNWRCYISGRERGSPPRFDLVVEAVERELQLIFRSNLPSPSEPIFPALWYRERIIRDALRETVLDCVPGTSLEEVATKITNCLSGSFSRLLEGDVYVGIYLDTGDDWRLCGVRPAHPWLGDRLEKRKDNAFSWVAKSTRPVLIRNDISDRWRNRLIACGAPYPDLLKRDALGGMCLAPILYGPERSESFGVVELASITKQLTPAHLFLLSRLSVAISGCLFPLMRLPGFPWWPEAKVRRGGAIVSVSESHGINTSEEVPRPLVDLAKNYAKDLMPEKAKVSLASLKWGHSGAPVFRLDVQDEGGILEVPRVLKIGKRSLIRKELRAYYRYVHNKSIGSDARIDIARSSVWPVSLDLKEWFGDEPAEAIVYTFVGAGEKAVPWSQWCREVAPEELNRGLELLSDRLQPWYRRTKQPHASQTVIDLMIEPLAEGRLRSWLSDDVDAEPSLQEVRALIDGLYRKHAKFKPCTTAVVHGDLHSDNLLAVLDSFGRIKSVALIDWANVRSGWHQLTDISRLIVDLVFRISPSADLLSSYREIVQKWGQELGCSDTDWAVTLIHQLAKVMFYQEGTSGRPSLTGEARSHAWRDLQELVNQCTVKKAA